MYYAKLSLSEIPEIGFAHQHYCHEYKTTYGKNDRKSVEIAYVNSGKIKIRLYDKEMYAEKGSVVVILRQLPISTLTVGDEMHSHCTVLGEFSDLDFELFEDEKDAFGDGFMFPLVTEACKETEQIAKCLLKIAADMANEREKRALSSSVEFLNVLKMLDEIFRKEKNSKSSAFVSIYEKAVSYINDNVHKNIRLSDIARFVAKSPNHVSHAFKAVSGKTISSYINEEKVKRIAYFIKGEGLSFEDACERVSLCDKTYGYRLFKKYMGITPSEFVSVKRIDRDSRGKKKQ